MKGLADFPTSPDSSFKCKEEHLFSKANASVIINQYLIKGNLSTAAENRCFQGLMTKNYAPAAAEADLLHPKHENTANALQAIGKLSRNGHGLPYMESGACPGKHRILTNAHLLTFVPTHTPDCLQATSE